MQAGSYRGCLRTDRVHSWRSNRIVRVQLLYQVDWLVYASLCMKACILVLSAFVSSKRTSSTSSSLNLKFLKFCSISWTFSAITIHDRVLFIKAFCSHLFHLELSLERRVAKRSEAFFLSFSFEKSTEMCLLPLLLLKGQFADLQIKLHTHSTLFGFVNTPPYVASQTLGYS